mgnify:FL=1
MGTGTFGAGTTLYTDFIAAGDNKSALVAEALDDAGAFAEEAQDRALKVLEQLGSFSVQIPVVTAPIIPIPEANLPVLGDAPQEPTDLLASFPAAPEVPSLGSVSSISLPQVPEFNEVAPIISNIAAPAALNASLPAEPSLSNLILPDSPSYTLPSVPTLAGLNLPVPPSIDIPFFSETVGELPLAPSVEFAWNDVTYSSTLLDQSRAKLLDVISGEVQALSPEAEEAIWNRARDREARLTQGSIEAAMSSFAARGFQLPSGTLVRIVQEALQEQLQKESSLSRDIMIKQAEMQVENFRFTLTAAIQLEGKLIDSFNLAQARSLDAAKFTFQSYIELFNAKVSLFQADVQAFQAKAEIFKTQLQAELARLEIYKSEIEGQKLVAQLNESQVRTYVAQLDAIKTVADIYRAQVDAAKAVIEADGVKVEMFRSQIAGYESLVKAKSAEFEGYATRVRAEATKIDMYTAKTQAFKSRAEAFDSLVKATLGASELDFKQKQEFPLEVYKQKTSGYLAAIQAESSRINALADVYKTRVDAFAATEGAKSELAKAQTEVLKSVTDASVAQAELSLKAIDQNIRMAIAAHETAQQSLRAAGQLAGQLAAAALSARNISASLSSSDQFGTQNSISTSSSDSTSTITQTIASDNLNVNYNYNSR